MADSFTNPLVGLCFMFIIVATGYSFLRAPSTSRRFYSKFVKLENKPRQLHDCPQLNTTFNLNTTKARNGYKALVTGVAGFIASHVAKDCVDLGFEVVGVDDMSGGFRRNVPDGVQFIVGDFKDAEFVSKLIEEEKFDVVYHLAAYAAEGLSHFIRNYNYKNNLVATTNLITQSVRVGSVKKFIFTSSIAAYGSGRTPMTEDMEPLPEDPYGISKLACEYDLKAAYEMFGLPFVIFRPHNVYGPGQNMYDKYRNVVGIFLNQLQSGKDLTIFGDGGQTRKFSYVSDVSFPIAVSGVLDHVNNQVFNVGGDIATTVTELAVATKEIWGNPGSSVKYLDSRNEVLHAESDHQKLNCFFPGLPKPVGLRDGLHRMVQWAKITGKHFEPVAFDAVEIKKNMPPSWITPDMKQVAAFHHSASRDDTVENELGNKINKIDSVKDANWIQSNQIGFYIQVYNEKKHYIANMLTSIRLFYPNSPMTLLSDHGPVDYSSICEKFPPCTYVWAEEQINVDAARPPYVYTCEKQMKRMVTSIKAMGTSYAFLWESDTRAVGSITKKPSYDLMQMYHHLNSFDRWEGLDSALRKLYPGLDDDVKCWSSTGGTLFDARKIISWAEKDPFHGSAWHDLINLWPIVDRTEDVCLFGSALSAGMTLGEWKDYTQPGMLHEFPKCGQCIKRCRSATLHSKEINRVPHDLNEFLSYTDICVYVRCVSPTCPAIIHGVKNYWAYISEFS